MIEDYKQLTVKMFSALLASVRDDEEMETRMTRSDGPGLDGKNPGRTLRVDVNGRAGPDGEPMPIVRKGDAR